MKRIALSCIFALVLGQAAVGADLATKVPEIPRMAAPSWTGFYLGGHAGWAWTSNASATQTVTFSAPAPGGLLSAPNSSNLDGDGPVVGLHAGYNYQVGSWLMGVEGDISGTKLSASQTSPVLTFFNVPPICTPAGSTCGSATLAENIRWLGSVRGRLGYAWGPSLFYVTGGAAWANVSRNATMFNSLIPSSNFPVSATSNQLGAVVGAGYEWMLSSNWLLRGEFLHYMFKQSSTLSNTLTIGAGNDFTANNSWSHFNVNVARLGLSYKFN